MTLLHQIEHKMHLFIQKYCLLTGKVVNILFYRILFLGEGAEVVGAFSKYLWEETQKSSENNSSFFLPQALPASGCESDGNPTG